MNRFERSNLKMSRFWGILAIIVGIGALPRLASACACGCGIFDLGIPGLPSTSYATSFSIQYDYMNQNKTQHDWGLVSGDLNPDKDLETNFINLFFQTHFNKDWGFMAMIPVWNRHFVTDNNGTPGVTDASQSVTPLLLSSNATVLSDIRVMGDYMGLSDDMSTGIQFGLKLPTGPNDAGNFYQGSPIMDQDTQPGTGTTDLLLGAYRVGNFDNSSWFVQAMWQHAFYSFMAYRPGDSIDAAAGIQYHGFAADTSILPTLQLNYQYRDHDQGGGDAEFGNADSGYSNLYLTPGAQVDLDPQWLANAEIYVPVFRDENGYQQVAPYLVNAGLTYQY